MYSRFFSALSFISIIYFLAGNVIAREHFFFTPKAEELEEARIFPFNYDRIDVRYDLFLNLADSAVAKKYAPVFVQYKLPFTGDVWEVVLRQALERIDKDVARRVLMLPEDEGLYIGTGNNVIQQKFLRDMLPMLSNSMLLEKHLKRLDRNKLPE